MKKGTIKCLCAFGLIYMAMKDSLEKYIDEKISTMMLDHYKEIKEQNTNQ